MTTTIYLFILLFIALMPPMLQLKKQTDRQTIGKGETDRQTDKFHVYRGNVSPLRGEKPIFGPLSKNNTGMAALCAGLPVTKTRSSAIADKPRDAVL